MQRVIRNQLLCMTVVMCGLLALGIWAHDFVIKGVMAKPALNIPIFLIFFAAAGMAMRAVYKLKNEILAMNALQIDYGPTRLRRSKDVYKTPAIVFEEPNLLGHAYRLITEELTKNGRLQIATATVQTIIHAIDQRISEKRGIISYFANLLVFLGLLGAFIGLMRTVGSVGDLIGGMDLSGKGGDDAFASLIEGMKAPLNGMSVGFSSSLFGLGTSLVLGSYERFMLTAMKTLRNEFESWLNNIAQLEASGSEEALPANAAAAVAHDPALALEAATQRLETVELRLGLATRVSEQTAQSVGRMAASLESLLGTLARRDDAAREASMMALAETVAMAQRDAVMQVNGLLTAQQAGRDETNALLGHVAEAIDRLRDVRQAQAEPMLLDVPVEAPGTDAAGARGLIGRLVQAYAGQTQARRYRAMVSAVTNQSARVQDALTALQRRSDAQRAQSNRILLDQTAAHRELVGAITALTRRVDSLAGTAEARDALVAETIARELREARAALDASIITLAHQVETHQKAAVVQASAAPDVVEAAVRRAIKA